MCIYRVTIIIRIVDVNRCTRIQDYFARPPNYQLVMSPRIKRWKTNEFKTKLVNVRVVCSSSSIRARVLRYTIRDQVRISDDERFDEH